MSAQSFHVFSTFDYAPVTGETRAGPRVSGRGDDPWPFVSVVLPTWQEERYIGTCLDSIVSQTYPLHRMEILVVDGMSTDRTRALIASMADRYPQIRLLDNPERFQAAGLNRAILASCGSVIVRLDAHSEYSSNYIKQCVETLRQTGADNVGGPPHPRARTFFQRLACCLLKSTLGNGGAPYRKRGQDGFVDTVFLGAFRRDALRRVGLFDPGAITNEDAELNQRIIKTGGLVYLNSAIECYYYPRDTLAGLVRQYFRYGRGRARTLLKHRRFLRLSSFIPFLFVLTLLSLTALSSAWAGAACIAEVLAAAYAGALLLESFRFSLREHWGCVFTLPVVFVASHFAHALGVGWGLLYYGLDQSWLRQAPPALLT